MKNDKYTRSARMPLSGESASYKKGRDYLLAIGIDEYEHFQPLYTAVKDVEDITNLLTSEFGFSPDDGWWTRTILVTLI